MDSICTMPFGHSLKAGSAARPARVFEPVVRVSGGLLTWRAAAATRGSGLGLRLRLRLGLGSGAPAMIPSDTEFKITAGSSRASEMALNVTQWH